VSLVRRKPRPLARDTDRLDVAVAGGDVPQGNTTRINQLWASIWERLHAGQLPEEWRRSLCTISWTEHEYDVLGRPSR
jgi:hypothetical protein